MTTEMISAGAVIAFGSSLALSYFHEKWKFERSKHLFVDEIECPKCGARPNVPCFFSGGYACMARFAVVESENERRQLIREQSGRAKRR